MFGFSRLGSFDYFAHLERALVSRFVAAGRHVRVYVVEVPPTASIRRRAARLAELVARTCGDDDGPIHLLGHSTGGLDVRLCSSPSCHLPVEASHLNWLPRLRTVTTLSTPHFGTPLATFFATASGQRALYALSALSVVALSVGAPPMAAATALLALLGRGDGGVDVGIAERTTGALLRVLEPAASHEVRDYLAAIRHDQGAVIQLTPEAMDLFQAGVENRPGVFYQCSASMAPSPSAKALFKTLINPIGAVSASIFATLYNLTARFDERYPCAAPFADARSEAKLMDTFARSPGARVNDGIVPLRSQLWGHLAWCGYADHLDILGHFHEDLKATRDHVAHSDWMRSGAHFNRQRFSELCDALAKGMLSGSAS